MDLAAAIDAIHSSPLRHHADVLIAGLRPSVRIRATRNPAVEHEAVSKFAGSPCLPRGAAWPTWDASGYRAWSIAPHDSAPYTAFHGEIVEEHRRRMGQREIPLHFLAQIRLDDLGPLASAVGLPEHGFLLFFYDVETSSPGFLPESRGCSRVLWVKDEPVVAVAPPGAATTEFCASALTFELEYTLDPQVGDDFDESEREALGDLEGTLDGKASHHRLGGPPQEIQGGLFRTCQLASNGVRCGSPKDTRTERVRELAKGAKDWRLLLQLDTDFQDATGWMWGDVGRLYFCIHADDLRAARFDRVWVDEQCC